MILRLWYTLATMCLTAYLGGVEPYLPKAKGYELIAEEEAIVSPYSSSNEQIVSVKMASEDSSIQPGKSFWVCFQFRMGPDWHLYWKNPGDVGQSPTVHWNLPPGFRVSDLLWPAPHRFEIEQAVVYGYSTKLLLLAQILPPKDLEVGSKVQIKADVDWLGCSTVCVPGQASFRMLLDVSQELTPPSKHIAAIFKEARKNLPQNVRLSKASIRDDGLEISVSQDVPFGTIEHVDFFAEQAEVFDPHTLPTWQLSQDMRTLTVRVKCEKLLLPSTLYPMKGILVVQEAAGTLTKSLSWHVRAAAPKGAAPTSQFEKKYQIQKEASGNGAPRMSSVDEHLEALEHQIWYRRLLNELMLFLKSEFMKVLIYAFVGGIILNVMPCVLPVISIKLLHFVQFKGSNRLDIAKHGILYTFGVLISFWVLSATIYALQSVGHVVGWGFQLQNPVFVTVMIIILFLLGLSLFGVFEFGVTVAGAVGAWEQSFLRRIPASSEEPKLITSFASGILATLVASPCTGPLLGSTVGFAATLQPTYSFAIFSALGLGMAFPFLLISFFPGLIKFLPKPGRWMITFKQLMGFFMLGTVLWLVWVLDAQVSGLSNLLLLLSLFIIAVGAWIFGNWCGYDREKRTRIIGGIIALIIVIWGSWVLIANVQKLRLSAKPLSASIEVPSSQIVGMEWEPFSLPKLERYVEKGIPVFVDVSAKWCLTCQTNKLVLESDKVKEAFVKYGVVKMLADWTTNDESITRYIRSLGRNGVPVYALYSFRSPERPLILPEVLTQDIVINALKKVHEEREEAQKKE